MHVRASMALASAITLAACTTPAEAPSAARCDANAANAYVGKPADEATAQAARRAARADTVRIIRHDQVVTMEYLAGRLNLSLDANGRIERITCG